MVMILKLPLVVILPFDLNDIINNNYKTAVIDPHYNATQIYHIMHHLFVFDSLFLISLIHKYRHIS